MKQIQIKNFGPIAEAKLDLEQLNLIIGLQSSGKSCVMIVACYCTWVEKRVVLRQSAKEFEQGSSFLDMMVSYYRIKGYVHADTFISYKSDCMDFSYDQSNHIFSHKWKAGRWSYKRPKVSYVPAERNLVSLISNWNRLETNYDNILDFKADWDVARQFMKNEDDILGTGISYEYEEASGVDKLITPTGKSIELTSSSSGLQSLVPQFVHLDYLHRGIYEAERSMKERTFSEKQFVNNLLDIIYQRNFPKEYPTLGETVLGKYVFPLVVHIEGKDYVFQNKKQADKFVKEANQLLFTNHAEIFLEEPESNLFPPTQFQWMDWLMEMARDKKRKNFFFIATHSPYVLSYLLQENLKSFRLFLTYPLGNGYYGVKTASEEDVQGIYDNGSDAFFNFDAFVS